MGYRNGKVTEEGRRGRGRSRVKYMDGLVEHGLKWYSGIRTQENEGSYTRPIDLFVAVPM